MRFFSPEYIFLFPLIIIVLWYKYFILRPVKKGGIRFPLTFRAKQIKKSWKTRLSFLPDFIRVVVLSLLILALMQPQYGMETEEITREGIDIMIVFDISGSMAATDFKPNRMEAAKRITENFIMGISDHRLGLVVFSGLAATQCPLTLDYGSIVELLRQTDMGMLRVDGTAIGDGIITAVNRFDKDEEKERSRVIILLSDGENNAGIVDPLDAARIAASKGISIYSIGVGTYEGGPVPMTHRGRQTYARNRDGSLYMATFDEQQLKDIAYIANGKYFRATDEESLEQIYNRIADMQQSQIDIKRTVVYSERFFWFLAPAFALLAIEIYSRSKIFARLF